MQGRPALLELAFGRAWVEAKDPKQTGKPISKLVKERKAWRGVDGQCLGEVLL